MRVAQDAARSHHSAVEELHQDHGWSREEKLRVRVSVGFRCPLRDDSLVHFTCSCVIEPCAERLYASSTAMADSLIGPGSDAYARVGGTWITSQVVSSSADGTFWDNYKLPVAR